MFTLPEPLDNALSIAKGESWRRIRNTLSPTFSAFKLKGMTRLMNMACDVLMKKAEEAAQSEGSLDIVRSVGTFTPLATSTTFCFANLLHGIETRLMICHVASWVSW